MQPEKANVSEIEEISSLRHELYSRWDEMDAIDKINNKWFELKEHHNLIRKHIEDDNCLLLTYVFSC